MIYQSKAFLSSLKSYAICHEAVMNKKLYIVKNPGIFQKHTVLPYLTLGKVCMSQIYQLPH
jgi:hypothetical protein